MPPPINEAGSSTEMDVVLFSEEEDDDVFDVSFEPIRTPIPTGRSSTTNFTNSLGSKLKKIRLEEEAKINEEVDAYLYHLSKVDEQHIKCPLGWWKEIVSNIQKLLSVTTGLKLTFSKSSNFHLNLEIMNLN